MKTVYLAGAITGLSFGDATDWRNWACQRFNPGINGLSPMRAKDYLKEHPIIDGSYENTSLSSARGIMTRDYYDVQNCDMVLAYLANAEKVSIGTVMEIAWAKAFDKPLILVMEDGGIHEHPMISEATGFRTDTLDNAVWIVNAVLTAYVKPQQVICSADINQLHQEQP